LNTVKGSSLLRGVTLLLPVLMDEAKPPRRDHIVQQGVSGALALRKGDWKYIPANADSQTTGIGSGANPNDTRFAEARITEPLLFNLATDPGETRNLAAAEPAKLKELSALLRTIRDASGAATPEPGEGKRKPANQ
jgi:arylsulfatase A-like enzyme